MNLSPQSSCAHFRTRRVVKTIWVYVPVAIERFEELDTLEVSKCEMENRVNRALVAKNDARIDLLMKELDSQRAQFELAAVGAKFEMTAVQQRMLAIISDAQTSAPNEMTAVQQRMLAIISDVPTSNTASSRSIRPFPGQLARLRWTAPQTCHTLKTFG